MRNYCLINNKQGNKKGMEWTIFKIISFLLVAIFLALVIYGVASGQLQPLIKKAGMYMDSILTQLGVKKVAPIDNSKRVSVPGVGNGSLVFDVDKMECSLTLDNGERYKINPQGEMESYEKVLIKEDASKNQIFYRRFRIGWYFTDGKNNLPVNSWKPIDFTNNGVLGQVFKSFVSSTSDFINPKVREELPKLNMDQAKTFLEDLYKKPIDMRELWLGTNLLDQNGQSLTSGTSPYVAYFAKIEQFFQDRCR